ncbi:MAG: DNA repair protein RecN [Lachnospiraceae bacterium]|nr:DNA repair protein RecN [Lachnospiraceae bacterium]
MLQSLRVKNLALMEETEVEFGPGLNILTGETGAGKSLLIGSVNLAIGGKFDKDMLRKGADSAYVELIFSADDSKITEKLAEMELDAEDGLIIISRKMQPGKSVCRINGETVTAKQVKELAEVLIDIHGQHEHQSLLHKKKHLEILDAYCGEAAEKLLVEVSKFYDECRKLENQLKEESMDEAAKAKEQSLAEFEFQEIENAALVSGEDEELEQRYRFMVNSKKIMEGLSESYRYTGSENSDGAGNSLSRALRAIRSISMHDERLEQLEEQLTEVDNLLADYNRDVADYMTDCEFDGEDFTKVEERLNTINRLKEKYGSSIKEILQYQSSRQALLEKLADYDAYMERLRAKVEETECRLREACAALSKIRQQESVRLAGLLKEALVNLNFLTVEFEIAVRPEQNITTKGYDDVEFLISTNPGESLKALGQVASGGELSRVMLAIKTVLSGKDGIDTLIFDEIDAGISGRTAWKVAEQLAVVGREHQVLCITHLPQIAAMADVHLVIEKSSMEGSTITDIRSVEGEESLAELARLLGSDTLTEAALENARQMRGQALEAKR